MIITTPNLQLVPVQRDHAEAVLSDRAALAGLLGGIRVPDGWPQFPQAFAAPRARDLGGYFFIDSRAGALVGNGGYKGPPDAGGGVEIGYEIAPAFRNRGFASEAARALIAHAFARRDVRVVRAHTLGEANASNRVLRKVGMTFAAETPARLWRFEVRRPDQH